MQADTDKMSTEDATRAASMLVCGKEGKEHGTSAQLTMKLGAAQQLCCSTSRHGSTSSTVIMPSVSSMVVGMLSSIVVAALVAVRWGLPAWNIVQGSCQLSLFVLGCWVLPRDHSKQPGQIVKALGTTFTLLRMTAYLYVAIKAPPHYQKLLSTTWPYPLFGLYCAESTLLQALWHRLLPVPVCNLLGVWQACCFTIMSYRLTSGAMPWWRIMHLVITPQVGMFAPYHMLVQQRVQQLLRYTASHTAQSATDWNSKGGKSSSNAAAAQEQPGQPLKQSQASAARVVEPTSIQNDPCGADTVAAASRPAHGSRSTASQAQKAVKASLEHVHALQRKPYQSMLRASHMVCVKLDTSLPCSSLPHDMAQQLQSALRASIGSATSVSISGVAVRPGCICITMKVEEQLPAAADTSQGPANSQLQAEDLARTLLPELQHMLSTGPNPAIQRSHVQLDGRCVTCLWSEDSQTWEVRAARLQLEEPEACKPWLGVARAVRMSLQTASTFPDSLSEPASESTRTSGLLDLLAEVQLWGVSKVSDVEGWTPPQQHQDSELQWPGAQQASGSSPALKLLARAAGGYLPTQVVRLVPGSTDGYVTAQVVMQLHGDQLTYHHVGGAPSTLLLMDLELWQNEALLSSSPLLSLPKECNTPGLVLGPTAGWWGAYDSTVAKATLELQQCAEECMQVVAKEGAPAAIQTYVQYTQDLSMWLSQVQHTAHASQFCLYGPAHEAQPAAARLQQPNLPPAELQNLSNDLLQYAQYMKWQQVQLMLTQQMRNVVRPATHRGRCTSWWPQWQGSLRAVVMGYPCHHDEQLYQQQLAVYLSRVLVVSSSATAAMGSTWGLRALFSGAWHSLYHAVSWVGLHMAAVAAMIGIQRCGGAAGQQPSPQSMRSVYALVAASYLWKGPHLFMAGDNVIRQVFQHPPAWILGNLLLALSEQVPASVVLPASWGFAVSLFLEFPALMMHALPSVAWHPAVTVAVTFLITVGARVVVGVHLRRQVRALLSPAMLTGTNDTHAKVD